MNCVKKILESCTTRHENGAGVTPPYSAAAAAAHTSNSAPSTQTDAFSRCSALQNLRIDKTCRSECRSLRHEEISWWGLTSCIYLRQVRGCTRRRNNRSEEQCGIGLHKKLTYIHVLERSVPRVTGHVMGHGSLVSCAMVTWVMSHRE